MENANAVKCSVITISAWGRGAAIRRPGAAVLAEMHVALVVSALALSRPAPARTGELGRRSAVGAAAAFILSTPLLSAAEDCRLNCFKECNKAAPGSGSYCATQCDSYCDSVGGDSQGDAVSAEPKPLVAEPADVAKKQSDEEKIDNLQRRVASQTNLGLFGDSGIGTCCVPP